MALISVIVYYRMLTLSQMVPIVYVFSFIVPSALIIYYKFTGGAQQFIQPFDAQTYVIIDRLSLYLLIHGLI